MCVKREGVGNLCGGLFTILMLIIMFSVAHRRFQELIYISLAFIAITLTLCIIFAIFNTVCKGEPLIDYWDSNSSSYYHTRHHSSRYRNHNYTNNTNNNSHQYNQQRVHVCTPPTMGGARLNIIYTIGQQRNNANPQQIADNQSGRTDRHSVALNIDNQRGGARLWHTTSLSSLRSPRQSTPSHSEQYLQFSPIITVMTNNPNDNYRQIINSYGDSNRVEPRLPLDSDIINGLNFQLNDLPPLYHQLSSDVIPDGPPTYEEAIEDKDNK